jgi:hypothetical protein
MIRVSLVRLRKYFKFTEGPTEFNQTIGRNFFTAHEQYTMVSQASGKFRHKLFINDSALMQPIDARAEVTIKLFELQSHVCPAT